MAKPIGVYIHIPFCRKRCSYCDFYSAVIHTDTVKDYVKSLKNEIYRWGDYLRRPADTVYFGGGTPSSLCASHLKELLDCVKDSFPLREEAEITVEINPENADYDYLLSLRNAGFNRLSIGVQSLRDETLKTLGRSHSAQRAKEAFYNARRAGFDNITVDIMTALPNQSVEDSLETVNEVIKLSPEHISCYMLILERKTALYAKHDSYSFPTEEQVESEYLRISDVFRQNGYEHYEISNFARKGKESKHNLKYWHTDEYVGIGPSAYSFLDGKRFHYKNDLRDFINAPKTVYDEKGGDLDEYVMLALRLKEGIAQSNIKTLYGKKYSAEFICKAKAFSENGFAVFDGERFYLTDKGMIVSNSIICEMTEEDLYEDL